MNEKRYLLQIPGSTEIHRLTAADIQKVQAQCEAALAQAESDKPKPWDFGLRPKTGGIAIRTTTAWWGGESGDVNLFKYDEHLAIHSLGNLKEIVEQGGPIVVGMNSKQAEGIVPHLERVGHVFLSDRIRAALARYKDNKSEPK